MIPYIGGKKKMQSWIVPYIPNDIETYVECFSGQFWIFFGMDLDEYPNLTKIVYNDFNALNYNLFRCVKDHARLLTECEKIQVQEKGEFPTAAICRENFFNFQAEIYAPDFEIGPEPNYAVAAKYVYVLTQVFSGANPAKSKFIDLQGKYHSKFTSFKNKLAHPKWQKLFESITHVENMDFAEVMEKYDGPKTYFYVDPPYYIVGEGSYYSNHGFNREDHLRLANCLKLASGRWSLSYYDFPDLSIWFPRDEYTWSEKSFAKAAAAKKGVVQTMATEILVMNY